MAGDQWAYVEVKGLDTLQRKFEEMPKKVANKGIRKALKAGANVFYQLMYQLAPVSNLPKDFPGFLRSHFGSKVSVSKGDELTGKAYIGPKGKVDYPMYESGAYHVKRDKKGRPRQVGRISVASVARFLEFGTSKMGKRPFMTQAFERGKQQALDAVTEALREAVDEAASES